METLLWLIVFGIGALFVRAFFPAYFQEKGKNAATKEDIAEITHKIEEVKTFYAQQLKVLEHQNAVLIEQMRGQHSLRLAAADKRLAAHQEAFTLWRRLMSAAHTEETQALVLECQDWWNKNCLFLSSRARDAFNGAYFAASSHRMLLQSRSDAATVTENWNYILKAGEEIVAGADLPSLGNREAETAEPDAPT